MKRFILITLLLVFIFCEAKSQIDSLSITKEHQFGVNVGLTTGFGMSYRYINNKKAIQFSANPIMLKPSDGSFDISLINTSVTLLATMKSTNKVDFNFYESQNMIFDFANSENVFLGIAMGMGSMADIKIGYDAVMSVNIGLAFLLETEELNFLLLPDFGIGLYYKF